MSDKKASREAQVEPRTLDLGYLSQFVGAAFSDVVMREIERGGFSGLRFSHGYVFQHLLSGPVTLGELARHLEVTQQAVSKTCAELEALGYVERVADAADARVRRVRLSDKGREAVEFTRKARARLEQTLERQHGTKALADVRALLAEVLETLGGAAAVRRRRVLPPR